MTAPTPSCPLKCLAAPRTWGKNLGCESASPTKQWCYYGACYSLTSLCSTFADYIDAGYVTEAEVGAMITAFECGAAAFKVKCTDLGVEDSGEAIEAAETSIEDIIEMMEAVQDAIDSASADTDLYSTAYDAIPEDGEIGTESGRLTYMQIFPGVDSDSTSTINEFGLFYDTTSDSPILSYLGATTSRIATDAMAISASIFTDAYGNAQVIYSNAVYNDDSDISNPSPSTDGWVQDDDDDTYYLTWEYDAAELGLADDWGDNDSTTALFKKFNYYMGNTEEDLLEVIEELISAGVADMTTTLGTPQYTFKKIKHLALDTDNLSSFDEEEVKQTVATGLSTIEESSEESSY